MSELRDLINAPRSSARAARLQEIVSWQCYRGDEHAACPRPGDGRRCDCPCHEGALREEARS